MEGGVDTVPMAQAESPPVARRRQAAATIKVVSESGLYTVCLVDTQGPVKVPILLRHICLHPDTQRYFPGLVQSSVGLMTSSGALYGPSDFVKPGETVHLCSVKGLPVDDDSARVDHMAWKLRPELAPKLAEHLRDTTHDVEFKQHTTFRQEWGPCPEDYIGKNEYLHDTLDDLLLKKHRAVICFKTGGDGFKSRIVHLKVSIKGCRAKLALEMLCLFEGLDRDEYAFEDPSDKWIKPGIIYRVVSLHGAK